MALSDIDPETHPHDNKVEVLHYYFMVCSVLATLLLCCMERHKEYKIGTTVSKDLFILPVPK
jgi:hypothetical protein